MTAEIIELVPEETPAAPARKKPGPKPKVPQVGPGRIVLYVTGEDTIRPAIISRLNQDGSVDLSVFNSEGCVPVKNCTEADAEELIPGTWHWPVD